MEAFFNGLGTYKGTFGSTLNGQVQSNEFYAKARALRAALDSALDGRTSRPRSTRAWWTASTRGCRRSTAT
jgi:hypothetical protein